MGSASKEHSRPRPDGSISWGVATPHPHTIKVGSSIPSWVHTRNKWMFLSHIHCFPPPSAPMKIPSPVQGAGAGLSSGTLGGAGT